MHQFICGGEKYALSQTGTIWLMVAPNNLPATIEAEGLTLQRKSEFHVTLVATSEIVRKYGITDPQFKEKVVADFCTFVREAPIDFIRYGEYRFMAEGEKRTVVVMVEVSNLDKLVEQLNQTYGLMLEYPPTHVTLYTLQPDVGIFMTDSSELNRLTKPISLPIVFT